MKILEPIEAEALPFEHELQSTTGRLAKSLQNLNGKVLPIVLEEGENATTVRTTVYNAAKAADTVVATTVRGDTLYVWRKKE